MKSSESEILRKNCKFITGFMFLVEEENFSPKKTEQSKEETIKDKI